MCASIRTGADTSQLLTRNTITHEALAGAPYPPTPRPFTKNPNPLEGGKAPKSPQLQPAQPQVSAIPTGSKVIGPETSVQAKSRDTPSTQTLTPAHHNCPDSEPCLHNVQQAKNNTRTK